MKAMQTSEVKPALDKLTECLNYFVVMHENIWQYNFGWGHFYEKLQSAHDDHRKSSFLQRTPASTEPMQAKNGVWHRDMISLQVGVATTIVRNMLLYIKW